MISNAPCFIAVPRAWPAIGACLLVLLGSLTTGCGSQATTQWKKDTEKTNEPSVTSGSVSEDADRGDESTSPLTLEVEIARAKELASQQDFDGAASTLRKVLLVQPDNVQVLFGLASVEAARGNLQQAIDLLGEIPEDHPEAGIPALGQSADWCLQIKRYDEAERRYAKILERVPQAAPARRQLAYLLNRQGRRQEASLHVRELCKLGDIRQDELRSLIILSDAIYDDPSKAEEQSVGDRPYWPIGPGGEARALFGQAKFEEAVRKLHPLVASGDAPPSILALYGRAVAEAQDDERFLWWLSRTDERTRDYADYWAAVGAFESSQRRFTSATRALGEAIDRDPTDYPSMGRLRQCLSTLGDDAMSKRWSDRWLAIRETAKAHSRVAQSNPPSPEAIGELASLLFHLNRPLEAARWKSIEGYYRETPKSEMQQWNAEREHLVASGTGFPTQSDRLCGMDLSNYPLPEFDSSHVGEPLFSASESDQHIPASGRFQNIAAEIGLDHTYFVASRPQKDRFSIYQMLGGGAAVLDYDLDGACDLYFAQGGADPPLFRGDRTNQLFRNTESVLVDVTRASDTVETQYSIGLTAGDWNQDGFPDLVVANVGTNLLLVNNGDGTFTRQTLSMQANLNRAPASAAMADVTGDAVPDIIQSVYVDDPHIDLKPSIDASQRVLHSLAPGDFDAGSDWLIENDGSGGFNYRPFESQNGAVHPGLGVIVTDLDGNLGNEIFVGNDMYPNQLWVRDAMSGAWSDVAAVFGCAYGSTGTATASMGIATGDFDRNGTLDIHVTNFEKQNASLFMGERGAFQDLNVHYQLAGSSYPLVGFGTQAIDYENDGDVDLVVTNGHIDDSIENESPFMQPAQLLCNLGGRFQLAEVEDLSGYWSSDHLGRGLSRLDFNRDGKNDFVITHIGEQSALLLNQTPSEHHWLQIQLVGTKSERDSIGARVRIRFDGNESTDWVVAGDGYLSHNEAVVSFGLGESASVDEIAILWPSGQQQTIGNVPADRRLLIIEGQDQPYAFDSGP